LSINIGTEAVTAVQELRNNRDFERLVSALGVLTQTRVLSSAMSQVDNRVDATAYARGMYDLWEALHAAYTGLQLSQVKPAAMTADTVKRVKEAAKENA
jgi:hypothetical protein